MERKPLKDALRVRPNADEFVRQGSSEAQSAKSPKRQVAKSSPPVKVCFYLKTEVERILEQFRSNLNAKRRGEKKLSRSDVVETVLSKALQDPATPEKYFGSAKQ